MSLNFRNFLDGEWNAPDSDLKEMYQETPEGDLIYDIIRDDTFPDVSSKLGLFDALIYIRRHRSDADLDSLLFAVYLYYLTEIGEF